MIQTYTFEGKNKEEALKKCLQELTVTEENIYVTETETEGKLFKAKKVVLTVIQKEEIKNYMKSFIKEVGKLMGIDIQVELKEVDDVYHMIMASDQNPILIGKEGRTLNSLQLLLRQALTAQTGMNIKLNLDASGYKAKKMNHLEYEVKKIIKDVQHSKVDVKLDPMNSYERRLVHTLAQGFDHIATESAGEAPNRSVVIKYVEGE